MKTIGIIGNGFVGNAIAEGFKHYTTVKIYDRDDKRSSHSFKDTVNSDIVFISVPTPMSNKQGGRCNLSIIEDVFAKANEIKSSAIFVIKSTVPIGATSSLQLKYPNLTILHSPEFLTARSAKLDFITPSRNMVGYPKDFYSNLHAHPSTVVNLYKERFPGVSCQLMTSDESETVKYVANCFFAVKISYFNEIKLLCDKLELDWNHICEGVLSDGRIGISHYQVPGHDGKPGFGGTCFPKDINSLITVMKDHDIDPKILRAAWEVNVKVRPEKDWENFTSAVLD